MRNYRRTTSCWLLSQTLCFCLLLQSSGIAHALPPKMAYVSTADLEIAGQTSAFLSTGEPEPGKAGLWKVVAPRPRNLFDRAWTSAGKAGGALTRWYPWAPATGDYALPRKGVQVAQAGGSLPLSSRLMSAFLHPRATVRPRPPTHRTSALVRPSRLPRQSWRNWPRRALPATGRWPPA